MPDEIQLSMSMGLFVHDADQMRSAAYERLQEAWSGDDEFPYGAPEDVPLDVAVNSLLADALPVDLPGCRRGRLHVESAESDQLGEGADAGDDGDESDGAPDESADSSDGPDRSAVDDSDEDADRPADSTASPGAAGRP